MLSKFSFVTDFLQTMDPAKFPTEAKNTEDYIRAMLVEDEKPRRSGPGIRRSRYYSRFSKTDLRPSTFRAKRPQRLKLRDSLRDSEHRELHECELHYYYERVYVVARNVTTVQETRSSLQAAATLAKAKMAPAPITLIAKGKPREDVPGEEDAEEAEEEHSEQLEVVNYFGEEEAQTEPDYEIDEPPEVEKIIDFLHFFEELINDLKEHTEKGFGIRGELGGLVLTMSEFTLLVIEGMEDLVAEFFRNFVQVMDYWWSDSRVVAIEDIVKKSCFIPKFHCYRLAPVYTNETFTPATPNDPYLMREQHNKILGKLTALVHHMCSLEQPIVEETLPSHPFTKMMPEVQRFDLLLNCHRYYRTLRQFVKSYEVMVSRSDDVELVWPPPYNYTPHHTFTYTAFDANLTFPNYGVAVEARKSKRKTLDAAEAKAGGGGEEDAVSEKSMGPDEEEWVDQILEEEGEENSPTEAEAEKDIQLDDDDDIGEGKFYNPFADIDVIPPRRVTVVEVVSKKAANALLRKRESAICVRRARWSTMHGRGKRRTQPHANNPAAVTTASADKIQKHRSHASVPSPTRQL